MSWILAPLTCIARVTHEIHLSRVTDVTYSGRFSFHVSRKQIKFVTISSGLMGKLVLRRGNIFPQVQLSNRKR